MKALQGAPTNLLPNLAIGNATADNLNDPFLNIFRLDVHMGGTLVECQDSLRRDEKTKFELLHSEQ